MKKYVAALTGPLFLAVALFVTTAATPAHAEDAVNCATPDAISSVSEVPSSDDLSADVLAAMPLDDRSHHQCHRRCERSYQSCRHSCGHGHHGGHHCRERCRHQYDRCIRHCHHR